MMQKHMHKWTREDRAINFSTQRSLPCPDIAAHHNMTPPLGFKVTSAPTTGDTVTKTSSDPSQHRHPKFKIQATNRSAFTTNMPRSRLIVLCNMPRSRLIVLCNMPQSRLIVLCSKQSNNSMRYIRRYLAQTAAFSTASRIQRWAPLDCRRSR
jgi:hypothetical protein